MPSSILTDIDRIIASSEAALQVAGQQQMPRDVWYLHQAIASLRTARLMLSLLSLSNEETP